MGDVYRLPTAQDAAARLLERLIVDTIEAYPDERVATRWAALARQSASRYPGPPQPTQTVLDMDAIRRLEPAVRERVIDAAGQWLESYFDDVRTQLMAMHRDLLTLQKRVAELEVELEDNTR